jgi:predicted RNA-binding protein YlxR (DUF448 family)
MAKDDRRCISCRKIAPRAEFLRVMRSYPARSIEIDDGHTFLQGRSAYLCPTASCLQAAQKKNRLSRALKAPVSDSIYQQLGQLITNS